MASINNVQIKSLKTFKGREGLCSQGNIYLNGKKLGFWSQDSHGAICDDFDFDESLLDQAAKNIFETEDDWKLYGVESFLYKLLILMDYEKIYKKIAKKGYKSMLLVSDGFHISYYMYPEKTGLIKEHVEELKKGMFKRETPKVVIFHSLDDFNIIIDKEHPMPEWL